MPPIRDMLDSLPSALDKPVSRASQEDLLAEERASRRRGLRRFLPFRFLNTGRGGLAFVLLFVLGGSGVLLFVPRDSDPYGRVVPDASPVQFDLSADGRLGVGEASVAARYGSPLGRSTDGVPIIQVESTGEIREITPLELEFAEEAPGGISLLSSSLPAHADVVWNPGPKGLGQYWEPRLRQRSLEPLLRFGRSDWLEWQEERLAEAVELLSQSISSLGGVAPGLWEPGAGQRIHQPIAELRELYPEAHLHDTWAGVPLRWVCDPSLEQSLTVGITLGCPGPGFDAKLVSAWDRVGSLGDSLALVGEAAIRGEAMGSRNLAISGLQQDIGHYILDLIPSARELDNRLIALSIGVRELGYLWLVRLNVELPD